jgi:tRNA dimethylallyltransferase
MQVYKYMDIGTAKITSEEMAGVTHYLISEFYPDEEFSVVKFQQYAKRYIESIHKRNKIPILVGGTGFYIQSILYDIDFEKNDQDKTYREELEVLAKSRGGAYLHELLAKLDPLSAEAIHPNNVKRIIRALEYFKQTGKPISIHNSEQRKKDSPYNYNYFVLNKDRDKLYDNINRRVDIMINDGLLEEVRLLKNMGYTRDLVSMQGLGYKEILDYIEGRSSLDQAIEILKRDTRHYAKRQLTWFKREKEVIWVNKDDFEDEDLIIEYLLDNLRKSSIIT